jgi:hypothetical protein
LKNLKHGAAVRLPKRGRYAFGNLEATPIVEVGIIYVPGWR